LTATVVEADCVVSVTDVAFTMTVRLAVTEAGGL
jgi:hypothetical protein